ncbi:hypothetical protein EDD16DRAFT_1021640 [Pisolithus croceorrhizus]|nr:hypothetical protein EDD16DRAFT_1021640 [Pisolithus croceorrhizus]KAI6131337.1 hypothetical protein EV401DRAFT_415601 [Pisolithus croceorrhizus]
MLHCVRSVDVTPAEMRLSQGHRNVVFRTSMSFHPESASFFSSEKYNSYAFPIRLVFIMDGTRDIGPVHKGRLLFCQRVAHGSSPWSTV